MTDIERDKEVKRQIEDWQEERRQAEAHRFHQVHKPWCDWCKRRQ